MPDSVLPPHAVTIRYRNHRGVTADRRIVPDSGTLRYSSTDWHPERQWVFDAYDIDKAALRTFALRDVLGWDASPAGPGTGNPQSGESEK